MVSPEYFTELWWADIKSVRFKYKPEEWAQTDTYKLEQILLALIIYSSLDYNLNLIKIMNISSIEIVFSIISKTQAIDFYKYPIQNKLQLNYIFRLLHLFLFLLIIFLINSAYHLSGMW